MWRWFQLTAARRRLGRASGIRGKGTKFQLTAARRRLGNRPSSPPWHSRFNSQPPEGGWFPWYEFHDGMTVFQLTAARRRLVQQVGELDFFRVSTHSRPKAAGIKKIFDTTSLIVSTPSRPKAAGISEMWAIKVALVSTHSRPKAAGSCF